MTRSLSKWGSNLEQLVLRGLWHKITGSTAKRPVSGKLGHWPAKLNISVGRALKLHLQVDCAAE